MGMNRMLPEPAKPVRPAQRIGAVFAAFALLIAGCAPRPDGSAGSNPRSLPSPQSDLPGTENPVAGRGSAATVDAILPTGRNLFLFDFNQSRYQKWTMSTGQMDTLGLCRMLDTLGSDWAAPAHWLAIPEPIQTFAPMRAFWGPSGNFFLLDRAGKRLAAYDSGAQIISSFPLPREIRDRNLDRFEVFWTRDGLFSFLDLGDGTVRQYAELRTLGGQGDWRLRNTVRLPVGLQTCLWEPFFREPCCLQGAPGALKGVCFDKYFNPTGPWPSAPTMPGLSPTVSPDGWRLVLDGGPGCAPGKNPVQACFSPEKGLLPTCPAETEPAPLQ
jgi:hypothetical protein